MDKGKPHKLGPKNLDGTAPHPILPCLVNIPGTNLVDNLRRCQPLSSAARARYFKEIVLTPQSPQVLVGQPHVSPLWQGAALGPPGSVPEQTQYSPVGQPQDKLDTQPHNAARSIKPWEAGSAAGVAAARVNSAPNKAAV